MQMPIIEEINKSIADTETAEGNRKIPDLNNMEPQFLIDFLSILLKIITKI